MGLELDPAQDKTLHELQRLAWILANLVTGGCKDIDDLPVIRLVPGLADLGTWCCTLDINFTKEKLGRGLASFSGTIEYVTSSVRAELVARLGNGYL